jgi:hypothetical protein
VDKERIVRATAGGKDYRVTFDRATGEILCVNAIIDRFACPYERVTWDSRWGTKMTLTAACAGRAAVAVLAARVKKD